RSHPGVPQAGAGLGGAPRRRGPRGGPGALLPRPGPETRSVSGRVLSRAALLLLLALAVPGRIALGAEPDTAAGGADAGVERTVEPQGLARQVIPGAVRLGDPFVYRITLRHPPGQRWELRTPRDLGGFELLEQNRTRQDGKDQSSTTYLLKMSLFQLGSHVLPTLVFDVVEPGGGGVARIDGPDIEAKSSF